MKEESRTESLTDMADDVFAESLKSPECIEILLNCLKNVERQRKDIYTLAHSTQDHETKNEKQLIDLTESMKFLSDKFKEYEEDRAKIDKIIEDLKSEVDSPPTKTEKLRNSKTSKNNTKEELSPLIWIAEEKEEITDEVIINTLNEKLDLDTTLWDKRWQNFL